MCNVGVDLVFFDEDYVAIDGLTYIERVDDEFVNFPHMPELWVTPKYKEG